MRILQLVDFLHSNVTELRTVDVEPDVVDVEDPAAEIPCAWVDFQGESSEDSTTIQSVVQRRTRRFSILICARAVDAAAQTDQVQDVRDAIFNALLGHWFEGTWGPVTHVSGSLEARNKNLRFWRDIFQLTDQLRSNRL